MMKSFSNILLSCILYFLQTYCFSQVNTDITPKFDYDTNYVKSHADKLALKLYGVSKSNEIKHVDDESSQGITYKPNERFNVGLGFSYQWFSLDLAFNLLLINNDDEKFGTTDRFDIQSNIYLRKFAVDFNMQFYEGYYVVNPQTYLPMWMSGQPYPQRPDFKSTSIGASGFYLFNHDRFSYRSSFVFNERQKKSAGSWLVGGFVSYFTFNADSTIVPMELTEFNQNIDFRKTRFIRVGAMGGYAHTFVFWKKFFLSITLAVGFGPEIRRVPDDEINELEDKTVLSLASVGRSSFGYNSEKYFVGVTAVGSTAGGGDEKEARIEHSVNNLRIFIGRRFDVSKWKLPK